MVKPRERSYAWRRAFKLLIGELNNLIEMRDVARSQDAIIQHCAKCRGHRHGQLERDALALQPLHHADQRHIRLGDCFKKPSFLVKGHVLWMPHERQMGMQDKSQRSAHTVILSKRKSANK